MEDIVTDGHDKKTRDEYLEGKELIDSEAGELMDSDTPPE